MGILNLLQQGSQRMGGLLFPHCAGVDRGEARSQAMMQLARESWAGRLRWHGAAQDSGYAPIGTGAAGSTDTSAAARIGRHRRRSGSGDDAGARHRPRPVADPASVAGRELDPSNPQAYAGGLAAAAAPHDPALALDALKKRSKVLRRSSRPR